MAASFHQMEIFNTSRHRFGFFGRFWISVGIKIKFCEFEEKEGGMMGEEELLVTSSVCVSQLFLTSFIFKNGGQEVVRERGSDAESFFQFVGENF